jgi:hypothetical protein
MRNYEQYEEILKLWELGISKRMIASVTGIPRGTVTDCIIRYGSVDSLETNRERAEKSTAQNVLNRICEAENEVVQNAYSYLLGLYLGDGAISSNHRVFRLRVALDKRYPNIIQSCVQAIEIILPDNQIGIVDRPGCVNVSCYHKFWPEILPQHGLGRKHNRDIILETWQQQIVDTYPLEFFRGLYHSDGSRFSNIVNGRDYPRYQFTNHSDDICNLFCAACDRLGIHWTVKHRKSLGEGVTDIFISKRKDVEYLDQAVGPKS